MIKDIHVPKVEDIALAVILQPDENGVPSWYSFLINLKDEPIEGVLVRSSGYGQQNDESVKTSELRYFLDTMEPKSYRKIELIPDSLLGLTNQYWVSFYQQNVMYDKKYIFVPVSITEENMGNVPVINTRGVLII